MNSLALALSRAGFAPRSAPTPEWIRFHEGEEFVVIFGCPRHKVLDGIQVLPMGICARGEQPPAEDILRFSNAKVDLDGLLARCTVEGINVREVSEGFCEVFINCTASRKSEGFKHWAGLYEDFVRSSLPHTWAKATFKRHDGRTSLKLRNSCAAEDTATKLFFAIGPSIAH